MDRQQWVDRFERKYDEMPVARGITTNGKAVIEVLASESGSWTLIVTGPQGRTCLVASGEAWEGITPPSHGRDRGVRDTGSEE